MYWTVLYDFFFYASALCTDEPSIEKMFKSWLTKLLHFLQPVFSHGKQLYYVTVSRVR